jgi:hypothetical protein
MTARRPLYLGVGACLALSLFSPAIAETLAAQPSFSGTVVGFVALKSYSNGTLTVVGPNGFVAGATKKGGLPSLDLGTVADGRYTYELDAATALLDTSAIPQNNGRPNTGIKPRRSAALSGTFLVRGGSIFVPVAAAAVRSGGTSDQD